MHVIYFLSKIIFFYGLSVFTRSKTIVSNSFQFPSHFIIRQSPNWLMRAHASAQAKEEYGTKKVQLGERFESLYYFSSITISYVDR